MKPYRLELVRRQDDSLPEGKANNASITAAYLRDHIFKNDKESWREKAYLLTLDSALNITGVFHLSSGGMSATQIDPHLVAIIAAQTGAPSVILAHNHPSGTPRPGSHDIQMTSRCKNMLDALCTSLMDHIILGEKSFYSFSEERENSYPES